MINSALFDASVSNYLTNYSIESLPKTVEVALKILQEAVCYSSRYALEGMTYLMQIRASSPSFGQDPVELQIFLASLIGLAVLTRFSCCTDCYFQR